MSTNITSRPNMTVDQIWEEIVRDCHSKQKTINCGSALRRQAIIAIDERLKRMENIIGEKCTEP